MKVTVERGDDTQKVKYPCLMETNYGKVVLFYEERVGTVVAAVDTSHSIGYHSDTWDMKYLTPFKGTVTLQND